MFTSGRLENYAAWFVGIEACVSPGAVSEGQPGACGRERPGERGRSRRWCRGLSGAAVGRRSIDPGRTCRPVYLCHVHLARKHHQRRPGLRNIPPDVPRVRRLIVLHTKPQENHLINNTCWILHVRNYLTAQGQRPYNYHHTGEMCMYRPMCVTVRRFNNIALVWMSLIICRVIGVNIGHHLTGIANYSRQMLLRFSMTESATFDMFICMQSIFIIQEYMATTATPPHARPRTTSHTLQYTTVLCADTTAHRHYTTHMYYTTQTLQWRIQNFFSGGGGLGGLTIWQPPQPSSDYEEDYVIGIRRPEFRGWGVGSPLAPWIRHCTTPHRHYTTETTATPYKHMLGSDPGFF